MICPGNLIGNISKDCSRTRLRGYTGLIHLYDYRGYMLSKEEYKNSITIEAQPYSISCEGKTITRDDGISGFSHTVIFDIETEDEDTIRAISSLVNTPIILFADMQNGRVMRAFPFTGGKIAVDSNTAQGQRSDIYKITVTNYYRDFFETTPPIESGFVGEARFGDSILDISIPYQFGEPEIDEENSTVLVRMEAGHNADVVPVFTLSPGATISPTDEKLDSFSTHKYIVTDEVDRDREWSVTLAREVGTGADVYSASAWRMDGNTPVYIPTREIKIDRDAGTIDIRLAPGEALEDVAVKLGVEDLGTQSPTEYTTLDFNSPQVYTTTSEDGLVAKEWTVRVTDIQSTGYWKLNTIGTIGRDLIANSLYYQGTTTIITADIPEGLAFKQWRGDTHLVNDIYSQDIIVTIPEQDSFLLAEFEGYDPPQLLTLDTSINYATVSEDTDNIMSPLEGMFCFEIYPLANNSGLGLYWASSTLKAGVHPSTGAFYLNIEGTTNHYSNLPLGEWSFIKLFAWNDRLLVYINGVQVDDRKVSRVSIESIYQPTTNSYNQNAGGFIRNIYINSLSSGEIYYPLDDDYSTGIAQDTFSEGYLEWFNREEVDMKQVQPLNPENNILGVTQTDWMVPEDNLTGELSTVITDNESSGTVVITKKSLSGTLQLDVPFILSEGATITPTGEQSYSFGVPIDFVVKAESQTDKTWSVTINESDYTYSTYYIMNLQGALSSSIVRDDEAGTIHIPVNSTVDISNLDYNSYVYQGTEATADKPFSGTDDFTDPWEIVITSDAGDIKTWTITVEAVAEDVLIFEDNFEGENKWNHDVRYSENSNWVGRLSSSTSDSFAPTSLDDVFGPGKVEIKFKMKLENLSSESDPTIDFQFLAPILGASLADPSFDLYESFYFNITDVGVQVITPLQDTGVISSPFELDTYYDVVIFFDGINSKMTITVDETVLFDIDLLEAEAALVTKSLWRSWATWFVNSYSLDRTMYLEDVSITVKV